MKEIVFMNRKKIVITLIFSILMGWFLEFICVFNFSTYKDICLNADKKQSVSSDRMELINFKIHNNSGIVTSNNDAQIIVHDVNSYVGSVEIKLKKPVNHSWMLQIFYCKKEEGFSQEASSIQWVSKYQKSVLLEINQEVVDLRIDLGDEPDTRFLLNTITVNPSPFAYVLLVVNYISCIKVLVYTILIFLFGLFSINASVMAGFVYTHRWLIGGSIILFCTICKIHGSSIGFYADMLPGYPPYEELWGRYRGIRSDEFVVSTQMALAQVKAGFPWFSELYRYSPTDMAVIAAQMIKNLVVILYRPFQAGYLFFGAQHGLAFYWSARSVVCFLVSFEFGRLFTNNKRKLAVAYALLVTLSPVIQWFFAAGGLIEILVFGQAAILLLIRYIREEDFRYKFVYMVGMVVCAGGYVMSLYPAYQIPFFYVFLTCTAAVLIESRKAVKLGKCDLILWIGGLAVFVASMAYVITKSSDAIETVMHTVYPGSREVTGGTFSDLTKLFQGWSSIFWSVIDIENPCEASSFVDFFPLGIILSVPVLVYYKKRDIWVISFEILNIILLSFTAFQWPQVLAKITLLSNVPIQRLIVSIGLLNLMLLIRCIAVSGFGQAYRFFVRIIFTIHYFTTL